MSSSSNPTDVALVLVRGTDRRAVIATVTADATVADLSAALGCAEPLYRHERPLAPDATLVDAGVMAGDELGVGAPVAVDWRQLGAELRIVGGDGAGLRRRIDSTGLVIGRGAESDVVLTSRRLSRAHAHVAVRDDGFTVRDLGSHNGVAVEGEPLAPDASVTAEFGAVVHVGDSLLTVSPATAGSTSARRADPFHLAYAGGRATRVPDAPAAPPATTAVTTAPRRSIVPLVVPSAGAAALAATASGAPAAVALAATPVALIGALGVERAVSARAARRAERETARATSERAVAHRSEVLAFARARRAAAPNPALLRAQVDHRGGRVWSASTDDVALRLGMVDDDGIWLPYTVGLRRSPIVVAGTEATLDGVFTWLVVQAVALVPARDLDVVVVSDQHDDWAWTAWLPHRSVRTLLPADAVPSDLPSRRGRRRLVVLDDPASPRWTGDATLSSDDIVVWRVRHDEDVPYNAAVVVLASSRSHLRVEQGDDVRDDVLADAVPAPVAYASDCALALSRLRPPVAAARPGAVRLTEVAPALASTEDIVANWAAPHGPLRAAIGVDDLGVLDVVLDGQNSHALVAGTTGSGKTRLLETLVLSLAATRSPAQLNVLIIDFKGGNELAALAALPHCVGLVSDREVSEVDRAVSALSREIARRDELFASVGATDLTDYVAKTGADLPRLVVIADEFGQFRRDDSLGGRVATLLRIAAQGRSKGLHLVLATQSPSTDVTAEIRQNVGVRMCLRVAEAGESVAVLGVADAARLGGPGEVLVGHDNQMQAGRVATVQLAVDETPRVRVTDLVDAARGQEPVGSPGTQRLLDDVVARLQKAAAAVGAVAPVLLAPPLRERIERRALPHALRPWKVGGLVFGARDRPGLAEPPPFTFDLAREPTLTIVGGARSGRTTALLALAEAARDQSDPHAPVEVHAIAWAHGLEAVEGAAGDGGVVRRGDFDHLRRTINWLGEDTDHKTARLVLIDRFDALLRDIREIDAGNLAARLLDALQDGPRRGVAVAVTVEPAALLTGAGAVLAGPRLVLPIDDPTLANAAGLAHRPGAVPGRGVAQNGDEVQIGLPAPVDSGGQPATGRVERMPSVVSAGATGRGSGERTIIGVGGAARLRLLGVDLDGFGPIIVVVGRPGSGRSTALRAFEAGYGGARPVVHNPETIPDQPSVLLLDDAARDGARRPWLEADDFPEVVRRGGHTAIVAFEQADLTGLGYRHWLSRRTYPGLMLSLDATPDRIVVGERLGFLPPTELRAGPPGRGWWCAHGAGVPVQVTRI